MAATSTSQSEVADSNCKHSNGAESPPPPPTQTRDDDGDSLESSRDQKVAPKDSFVNGGMDHKRNDSNNNKKPSADSSRSENNHAEEENAEDRGQDNEASGRLEAATEQKDQRTVVKREGEEEAEVDSSVVRPKAQEETPKSSFASELINNIKNSRNLLGNSHNELADEVGKNKEVSVLRQFDPFCSSCACSPTTTTKRLI